MQATATRGARRTVRSRDVRAGSSEISDGIVDLYEDRADVIIIRDALAQAPLAAAAARLEDGRDLPWARPNAVAPPFDVHILGTDTPATPSFSAPTGGSLEAYLAGAEKHRAQTGAIFPAGFDARAEIERALAGLAGGRPVEAARAADGREYTPFTLRRLAEGTQMVFHHDSHYALALYADLVPRVDTTTLVSYVFTVQAPSAGGELVVYGATADDPAVPRDANGRPDGAAAEQLFDHAAFAMNTGDLFLLASGRCYHRVSPVVGTARITMGGFLALDAQRRRVLYWS